MTTKERLHQLIEELAPDQLPAVERFIEAARAAGGDPVLLALLTAPEGDEPLAEEDAAALREARSDYAAGRGISLADLKRDLGLRPGRFASCLTPSGTSATWTAASPHASWQPSSGLLRPGAAP